MAAADGDSSRNGASEETGSVGTAATIFDRVFGETDPKEVRSPSSPSLSPFSLSRSRGRYVCAHVLSLSFFPLSFLPLFLSLCVTFELLPAIVSFSFFFSSSPPCSPVDDTRAHPNSHNTRHPAQQKRRRDEREAYRQSREMSAEENELASQR